jgi:flagellar biosynthetic protein FliQ
MTEGFLIELMRKTMVTIALMSAPMIGSVMLVGIISQIIQTVTQLKDQSLSFVPKVVVAGIILTVSIPWYLSQMKHYVEFIFSYMGRGTM